ncbi:MAG: radical SAM family heme chaperone HemW [Bacteroidota bacterium]|nr:radical SAM family heme chaperone HemW [Bacteroidota bacterium]
MAGIYIHIPYCKQACIYCNFHFSTSLHSREAMVSAMLREMELRQGYIAGETVDTIYFGGGTPSLLTTRELNALMQKAHSLFDIHTDAEITLEANPDDITVETAAGWKYIGINRLSIGIQSFRDEDLVYMKRAHNGAEALASIQAARKAGITNFSIDLIYGVPGMQDEDWLANLSMVSELTPPHFSAYALTVEDGTALAHHIRTGKTKPVDEDEAARHFMLLKEWAERNGYLHYEISNFCLEEHHSKHNSSYWKGTHYLGIGPSAHSYNGLSRQWNAANNTVYIKKVTEGAGYYESEHLSPAQQHNEYLMTSLRTMQGCDIGYVAKKFGEQAARELQMATGRLIAADLAALEGNCLILTPAGMLLADKITSDLFIPDEATDTYPVQGSNL